MPTANLLDRRNPAADPAGQGILGFLSAVSFGQLQSVMSPKSAPAGSYLFWEGDSADYLYYVRSGRIKLKKSTEDGRDITLSIMQAGDLLGEIGMQGHAWHEYSAEVCEDTQLSVIHQPDLETLMIQHGNFAVEFMLWMGQRQQLTQSKFRDLLLFGKTGALASTLIRMSNTFGKTLPEGILLDMKLSNTELAEFIGTTRESVNRMLHTFKEEGAITLKNGHIVIQRLAKLREYAHCPQCPRMPQGDLPALSMASERYFFEDNQSASTLI